MMRIAVFIDAGYLYAEGSKPLSASRTSPLPRVSVELNQPEIVAKLRATASEKAENASLLRIYWYDGVRGDLSPEQRQLAVMPDVKFRAGVVNRAGEQKGVDSLIVTDLIELARNHAISDAVLLSGDGDLRIAVQIAQSFGVRVHLISIEPGPGNPSRSPLLWQEADTTTEWSRSDVGEFLTLKSDVSTNSGTTDITVTQEISGSDAVALQQAVDEFVASLSVIPSGNIGNITPNWIPPEYDRPLIASCSNSMGRDLTRPEMIYVGDKFRDRIGASPPTP
jgi:uncharacterized LabA/DUF88 family protein